ncbi:hypothetical protein [Methanovulcanius yangii]|uniref:hypothetical protein n=1 Tax=Methanovulcanius yangii TaxID=1789227 RepID=UPI0029CA3F76|nr:hypothetical protein [Methanovulcanius yangii]
MKPNTSGRRGVSSAWRHFTVLAVACMVIILPCAAETVSNVAKGDPYVLTGVATGNPQPGLAVWTFGPNYWKYDVVQTEGSSFTYTLPGGETSQMSVGMYQVIVQHPMGNGRLDAEPRTDYPGPGQVSVVSADGTSFIIAGSGALTGGQAALALVNMLSSPNIDDTYFQTSFMLENAFVEVENAGTGVYQVGSILSFGGYTNMAVGNQLIYTVRSAEFGPTPKTVQAPYSGATGSLIVQPGSPLNTWEFSIDTAGWNPGYYIVEVESPRNQRTFSGTIQLTEGPVPTPTVIVVPTPTIITPAPTLLPTTPASPVPTESPAGVLAVVAAFGLGCLLARSGNRVE